MKKIVWILLIALILGGGLGFMIWKTLANKNGSTPESSPEATAKAEEFMWGVTLRPSALGKYSDEAWVSQLGYAKPLGVKWIRIGYDHAAGTSLYDGIIQLVQDNGFEPYLVVEPQGDFSKVSDPYNDGYQKLNVIASHYKGKIKYYQIMNEASGNAIKGGQFAGISESDYDATKYARTRDWIKGASAAIKKADPSAQRVVTSQWTHVGFLDKLKADNVDYDIIGWDWFSDMGLMGEKKLSGGQLLIDKLRSFNKPIILAECNYRPEGKNGQKGQPEAKQANYIKEMANFAKTAKLRGFFVLELLDNPNTQSGYTDYYGIVSVEKSPSGAWKPGEPRQAYSAYQEVIKKYSQ